MLDPTSIHLLSTLRGTCFARFLMRSPYPRYASLCGLQCIELTSHLDCDWGCGQCPCRCQVHLCSRFSGHQLDSQRVIHGTSYMGSDLCGALGFVVDHRRGYSGIQRCAGACGVYCIIDPFFFFKIAVETNIPTRAHCSPVGFHSVYQGCFGSISTDLVGS